MSLPAKAEQKKILKLLGEISKSVDDLLLSGLASASDSTRGLVAQSFQQASQMRLLRLGSTLRIAAEEIGRYAASDPLFSRRRYSFFVNRAWMMCQGMRRAIEQQDAAQWQDLTWQAGGKPVEKMTVIAMGVSKRVVPGAFCGFEFRLRCTDENGPLVLAGADAETEISTPSVLTWSTIFPMKKSVDVPPEAYLRLPQKQGFKASDFLDRHELEIRNFQLTEDGRVQLTDESEVELGERFEAWDSQCHWDASAAISRAQAHEPNPFELDIELQEEVVLSDWTLGDETESQREERCEIEVISCGVPFHVGINKDDDGVAFRKRLISHSKKKTRLPLFGVIHYERGRLMLQPLSVIESKGPQWLSLDDKDIDYRNLMKALNF